MPFFWAEGTNPPGRGSYQWRRRAEAGREKLLTSVRSPVATSAPPRVRRGWQMWSVPPFPPINHPCEASRGGPVHAADAVAD